MNRVDNWEYVELLQSMIAMPSFSRQEEGVAQIVFDFLQGRGVDVKRFKNNVYALSKNFDPSRQTLLLNSHIDTVKPNGGYTRDPFSAEIIDGKLYGLGSNDAGASVVSLVATFVALYDVAISHNLVLAITAEEECSGSDGIEALLPILPRIDAAIVGEPTLMQMAIGERGLLVIDCVAHGKAGHAAREEGVNAIYTAMDDIAWFKNYRFDRVSELFGAVKMSVTIINSGSAHNVIPDKCEFTVDIRVPECYRLQEVIDIVQAHVKCDVFPRSTRLNPSKIEIFHPLVIAGANLGCTTYGSPTTSDAALMGDFPVLKMGVGDSARSHSSDEFVFVQEILDAIPLYISLIRSI